MIPEEDPASEEVDGYEEEELEGDCCICWEELNEEPNEKGKKEVCRVKCGHVYHKSCILAWVRRNLSCPLCRRKIELCNVD